MIRRRCSDNIRRLSCLTSWLSCQSCWLYLQVRRIAAALPGFYHYCSKINKRLLPSSMSHKKTKHLGTVSNWTTRALEHGQELSYRPPILCIKYDHNHQVQLPEAGSGYCVSNTIDVHARMECSRTMTLTLCGHKTLWESNISKLSVAENEQKCAQTHIWHTMHL